MSFFIRNKRKQSEANGVKLQGRKSQNKKQKFVGKRKRSALDEEIESESDVDSDGADERRKADVSSEEEEETPQEKKLRLAKQYLAELEKEEAEKRETDDVSHDAISHRLQQDALEQSGKLHKTVSDQYTCPDPSAVRVLRGHQLPVTCAVISPDSKSAFSASKDGSIIKWCLETYRKLHVMPGGRKGTEKTHVGHTACILCLAISSDGKYLAAGDANNIIHIWDPATCKLVHTFRGHRKPVTGVAFRRNTHQLFSASQDRMVKIWNLDEMAYVESLYGHQDAITAIDSLIRERAVTCGGRDRSVRIWKVMEESQLVFHGHTGSIDCVSLINESSFITGGEDNCLCLWTVMKKKPVYMRRNAHGTSDGESTQTVEENWITAVASLQFTDLVASGSKDGCVRLWKCSADFRSLSPLFSVPVPGFINSLQFSPTGDFLLAGVGQEHRLGRWWRLRQAKNAVYVIPLPKTPTSS
ncbi:hypothetical protein BaRGS_00005270 [Batillaria attramentaria]|uniref:U3 small nucleolar RNA-interacting protein 2 n=1 Tax=Batillaria attramentaria TaxID=370345 RepID=A0ABD0LWD3_9CAEN